MPLGKRTMECDCGNIMDRDLNAARNILARGLDTLQPDLNARKSQVRRQLRLAH